MMLASVHGTAIRIGPCGVLIRGEPGAGKSSLALALMDQPGFGLGKSLLHTYLIADDQVELWRDQGKRALVMRPPSAIAGKLEIRGVGIVSAPYMAATELHLVADIAAGQPPDRMPSDEDKVMALHGVKVTRMTLWKTGEMAPSKLRAVVSQLVASQGLEA